MFICMYIKIFIVHVSSFQIWKRFKYDRTFFG